jgi:phosphate:Na+ symporter
VDIDNLWELLAGLGIFLFGMLLLEEAIKQLSGKAFKKIIHTYTEGRIKSILSGTFATAILQSSSAVSLMVLAFAGAGILSMSNAIGVMLGSNIGTTLTSWIVATIGFKVNMEAFSLPFIAIGGLGLIFLGKSVNGTAISRLLVGFGFLFMGLDYMKRSMDFLATEFDFSILPDYGAWFYLIIGFALTVVVQSSSASMAIILSMVYTGVVGFDKGLAMVIGTNMGTTVTIMLASIGGNALKKRIAYSHFFFNFFTGLLAFLFLPFFHFLINDVLSFAKEPVIGLALFHTLFNLMGVLVFLPFIGVFAVFISRLVPEKKEQVTLYLKNFPLEMPEVSEAGLSAVKGESLHLAKEVMRHNLRIMGIDELLVLNQLPEKTKPVSVKNQYQNIKQIQSEIFSFSSKLQGLQLSAKEASELHRTLYGVRYLVSSAKALKDVQHNLEELESGEGAYIATTFVDFRKKFLAASLVISSILDEDDSELNLAKMLRVVQNLNQEDDNFTAALTSAIGKKLVKEQEISLLISANRGCISAKREMLMAIKELKLNQKEEDIFDHLENTKEILSE